MGAESIRVMHPLFQTGEGGATPTSALQLLIEGIDLATAKQLNRLWHSRFPKMTRGPVWSKACFAATFEGMAYGVAVWSKPVARNLPQDGTWLELRRLAISPDAPRNTASRMLAIMARLLKRERPLVVVLCSYQDTEVHTGCIYKAAGWQPTHLSKDGDVWDKPSRGANPVQSSAAKQRWEKRLR